MDTAFSPEEVEVFVAAPKKAGRLEVRLTYCGDDDCGCNWTAIRVIGPGRRVEQEWMLGFTTDHQFDLARNAHNRIGRYLRKNHHDIYSKMEWPWDRKAS